MAPLPPNQLLHIGPDPAGASWNHFDLGQGLTTHINYPQSQLGNSPPQGQPWFYSKTNVDGRDVGVFSAPLGGATTSSGTNYARDELREYERDGTTKMAFDPTSGDHWIEGYYRIYGLTGLQKPSVCVQQMHDPNDDVIMVLTTLSGGVTKLVLRYNGTQVAVLDSSYTDGEEFYLKTRVNAGTPMVYYSANPAAIPTTPVTTSPASSGFFSGATVGWYSKSGSYNQTNELTDPNVDPNASIIRVEVRELKHWHSQTPKGGAWPTPATYAAAPAPGGATVDAGADATILPSNTFSRTATVTLNGSTLNSQEWKILSGPAGAGNVLSTGAAVAWNPSAGYVTNTGGGQTLGVGGIAKPAGATTGAGGSGTWSIPSGGTASNPKVYDGEGRTVGRVNCTVDNVVIQNYRINANNQYAAFIEANNVTLQNCDMKGLTPTGDGDLNVITMFGNDIKIRYNTAVNPVQGDPGDSHTDAIQTWVSSSHPNASQNCQVIGNKFTGPSNPSRANSVASIHQCIMVESAGHGGNSGGSGTPSNWLILDNEFGDSWNQSVKLDAGNNFTFARNNFTGSSDVIFALTGSGNTVYSSNTFGSGYGSVGASTTSGNGPADPDGGGSSPVTNPYPEGTYTLQFTAVTSSGTATDTVTVVVSSVVDPGGGGGGGVVGTYPSIVSVGAAATSDGSGTVTVPAPAGVTSGHFQICIIQDPGSSSITSAPSGWQLMDEQAVTNSDFGQPGGDSKTFVYYNTTGDSASRSWSKDSTRGYHAVRMAWKDWSSLSSHLIRGSSYTTTPYAPVVTPTSDRALVITVMGSDRSDIGPEPVTVPTGWTERYNTGKTVNVNEIQWISVAEIQVANRATTGANVPTGTGLGTSNFHLTNADNGAMFSFVLEGVIGSGTTVNGSVSLSVQPSFSTTGVGQGTKVAAAQLIASATLVPWSQLFARVILQATAVLNPQAIVFPRGTLVIFTNLSVTGARFTQFPGVELLAVARLWPAAMPLRKAVLRTDFAYPPPSHPFRLIAQRILDGEIVDWELPVADDFEYVEQLSGPIIMKGSFRPEIISVQELNLDGYAYWFHVEINQQIRASAIFLPPQYDDSAMNFSAEGIAAAPHYQIYDGVFQQVGVDPLSVVRTIWNYIQTQPQSNLHVVVSSISSPVRLGEAAKIETTVTNNSDGTTTTTTRDIPAKPYELVWWNGTNCGEEIDNLANQTPFDYVERHEWNAGRTDVLHYFDIGYPRIGVQRPTLLFNEENILEVVPIQEDEDSYASAVLVVGAGEGADTIRGYAAQSFGDRIRKEVVITDKTITTTERATKRALTELSIRRARAFEIAEIVINAYHTNAPIGSYGVGDDIRISVDIPWLMETHIAWYRITSISNKPSSDKVRIGVSHAGAFDYTEEIRVISPDDYIPFEPPPPPGPQAYPGNVQLIILSSLNTAGFVTQFIANAIALTVGKTLTVNGIATAPTAGTVTLISNKTLTVGAGALSGTATLNSPSTLAVNGVVAPPLTSIFTVVPTLTVGASVLQAAGFGQAPFGSTPFGGSATNTVLLDVATTLTVNANVPTGGGAASLVVGKTLTVGVSTQTRVAAVSMSVSKSLSVAGTVIAGTTLPVVRSSSSGSKSITGDTSFTVTKPTGLATGDYMLAIVVGDADITTANTTPPSDFSTLASQQGNPTSNFPTVEICGKVAASGDVAASTFTFNMSDVGDGVAVIIAITTGTYSSSTPVTVGTWTTQQRIASMVQTAPSMTGVVNGLLMGIFGTDTNQLSEAYPSSGPAGMTLVAQKQGTPLYAMAGIYSQALTSTAATGTRQVSPTPSGITTNGWTTISLIVNPG